MFLIFIFNQSQKILTPLNDKFRFHPSIIKSKQTFSIERKTAFQPIIEEFIKNIVTHVSTIMDMMFCHFLMFYEIFL